MAYGSTLVDTISSSGNLTITGNVTTSGTITSSTGTTYPLVSGTAQATTSGTTVNFSSIPSWVKRITIMLAGVSTSGTSMIIVQLGTGVTPTYTTSGYLGSTTTSTGSTITNFSSGFLINNSVGAATIVHGQVTITNLSDNIWTENGILGLSDSTNTRMSAGSVTLAAVLTALRITAVNGTDTFDAGSVNILYE